MLEPNLKKKIINTISGYEKKCLVMQEEILGLKTALQQLTLLPLGIYVDLDTHVSALQGCLEENTDIDILQQKMQTLTESLVTLLQEKSESTPVVIGKKVNERLHQLLKHLLIPEELKSRLDSLKVVLKKQLSSQVLSEVIDELTALVTEAFIVEQKRLKLFLQQMTEQLHDFDNYLMSSSKNQAQAVEESQTLESDIHLNIAQIKDHLDTAKTIDELSVKMGSNLATIAKHIKQYRSAEETRQAAHEKEVKAIQEKLVESEKRSEAMSAVLSFQRLQVHCDGLTGLANRVCYDEYIVEAFSRCKNGEEDLCLAVADVDHFKKINDNYGHLAGDKVLKKIAFIFKQELRPNDFVARFGGEEFVFIFENTNRVDAFKLVERIRKAIETCHFSYKEENVLVTISIGLTPCFEKDDPESLFARADKAMYVAKNQGRNCVAAINQY